MTFGTSEPQTILKHCPTHWLSLLHCVNHFIAQYSTENTCPLHSEMSRLVRLYVSNLLKPEVIIAARGKLTFLEFANDQQLVDENMGVGTDTWAHISLRRV